MRFTIRHLAEREKIKGTTNQSSAPLARSVAWLARLASRWALGNRGLPCPAARAGRRACAPSAGLAPLGERKREGERGNGSGVAPLKAAPPCLANLR